MLDSKPPAPPPFSSGLCGPLSYLGQPAQKTCWESENSSPQRFLVLHPNLRLLNWKKTQEEPYLVLRRQPRPQWDPPVAAISDGLKSENTMPPNKEASSLNSSLAGLICLPPISEELQLVWTQAAQTSELDDNEHLLQTFSYFPYPSLADIALLCLRYGLQMEKVKTWFMAQRLRCGISWSSEEIEETRARVVYHRDQLHFKSLLSLTHHAGRPPEDVAPSLSEPTQIKGLKVLANGAAAASKPLQPLGCVPQPLSPNEQALPPHLEPAWPQGLQHNLAPGRAGPAECLSADMQRHQRKTKRKTKEQLAILKSFFLQCQWARREDYHKLEQITGLPRSEIIQWFGDTRYALKHGQLKWFRDNIVPGAPSFQDPALPTPLPAARSLNEWAETPPLPTPLPPPDIQPLERYWAAHQQLQERDIPQLSQASRLSAQQVLDWFASRLPEPAEVVVCLDEEEEEEEEEMPEDDGDEEEEEEDYDDNDDDVTIQD
ncbi:homeobox and leucine zipper protein Homez isoform X4 [Echinops telfairi]|uniref:Homeobox and leucine zipper protein Homez isoform X4 n=1 Tax=Echinops telfairi TaxID=9371 RepID=A0AC55CWZ0_ECHTE|nr:homeobox and leucine zipper protein Homez isoform X4 [Echinops telfairi]